LRLFLQPTCSEYLRVKILLRDRICPMVRTWENTHGTESWEGSSSSIQLLHMNWAWNFVGGLQLDKESPITPFSSSCQCPAKLE
jgi:hypothetical protein